MRKHATLGVASMLAALALWFGIGTTTACHSIPSGGDVVNAVVQCWKLEQAPLTDLVTTLSPLLTGSDIDRNHAFDVAKTAGKDIGTCALAWAAQTILSSKGSPSTANRNAIGATVEKARAELVKGADLEFMIDGKPRRL